MFFDQDDIRVTRIKAEASNGVGVRFVPQNDGVELYGYSWPSAWSHTDTADDEFGMGQTIDDEDLQQRKQAAYDEVKDDVHNAVEEAR
ncbi:hypothetical protein [Natrinema sp. DC36]|uniref:hypothetical protein n=1 Tax=Natrinema sp. DC36 TaxID=2878680 RepID=UPI001CF06FD7|nr:hypothetical protein [Natrinema sp. DC36]